MRLRPTLFAVALGAVPLSASAQATVTPAPVDVTFFFPSPSPGAVLALDTAEVTTAKTPSFGALVNFALRSLVAQNGDESFAVVNNLTQLHLYGAAGLGKGLEFSALLPLSVLSALDLGEGPENQIAKLGDLRLRFKSALRPSTGDGLGIAISAELSAPTGRLTGSDALFLAAKGVEFSPGAAIEYRAGKVGALLNLGYTIRGETSLGGAIIDDRATTGLGLTYLISSSETNSITGLLEAEAELPIDLGNGSGSNETPAEVRAGVRLTKGALRLTAGAGAGVPLGDETGIGASLVRVFVSGAFAKPEVLDQDKDGILDSADQCINQPEDKDAYEDEDGCPEANDTDNDGILDPEDKCLTEPEDADSFEDGDGCPDLDNDSDGIPDTADKCANTAEDKDAFEDEDGCPDPDNDRDGIPDATDKCANEAETKNEYQDDDGCPDVAPLARVEGKRIIIGEQVKFATGKATIDKSSFTLLDTVARILSENPQITTVRVEGHTDDVGKPASNLKLSDSRAKAVATYLTKTGKIDAKRLVSKGYGQDCPLAENSSDENRAQNRRVEFVIMEDGEDPKGICRVKKAAAQPAPAPAP